MNARIGPVRMALDARRWHFQHGPVDLVIAAWGEDGAVRAAYERGWLRFERVLEELVAELPLLRSPVGSATGVNGVIARRMLDACLPFREVFITPMAAVAGAVADEVLGAMVEVPGLIKAYVNNGGDIALHVDAGEKFRIGIAEDPGLTMRHGHDFALDGDFAIDAALPVRGVATSGWRGRSWSMGIADSVTVLAASAAAADAAATLIANAVDVEDPSVRRAPACDVDDNTDLGSRMVTVGVGMLSATKVATALERGLAVADEFRRRGLIWGALLTLQGAHRVAGTQTGSALALQ